MRKTSSIALEANMKEWYISSMNRVKVIVKCSVLFLMTMFILVCSKTMTLACAHKIESSSSLMLDCKGDILDEIITKSNGAFYILSGLKPMSSFQLPSYNSDCKLFVKSNKAPKSPMNRLVFESKMSSDLLKLVNDSLCEELSCDSVSLETLGIHMNAQLEQMICLNCKKVMWFHLVGDVAEYSEEALQKHFQDMNNSIVDEEKAKIMRNNVTFCSKENHVNLMIFNARLFHVENVKQKIGFDSSHSNIDVYNALIAESSSTSAYTNGKLFGYPKVARDCYQGLHESSESPYKTYNAKLSLDVQSNSGYEWLHPGHKDDDLIGTGDVELKYTVHKNENGSFELESDKLSKVLVMDDEFKTILINHAILNHYLNSIYSDDFKYNGKSGLKGLFLMIIDKYHRSKSKESILEFIQNESRKNTENDIVGIIKV